MTRLGMLGLGLIVVLQLAPAVAAPSGGNDVHAYVTTLALNVRARPDTKSKVVGILLKYDPVLVTRKARAGNTDVVRHRRRAADISTAG